MCEQFFIARKQANLYTNFLITGKLNHKLDKVFLFHCLRNVILSNSYLSLYYSSDDRKLKPCSKICFHTVVSFLNHTIDNNDNTGSNVDEEMLEKLDSYKFQLNDPLIPLWKIMILNQNEIIILFEHLIDGTSSLIFLNLLVSEFNKLNSSVANNFNNFNNNNLNTLFDFDSDYKMLAQLPPTIDQYMDITPFPTLTNGSVLSRSTIVTDNNEINNKHYSSYICNYNYKSSFKILKFNKEETLKVLKLKEKFSKSTNKNPSYLVSIIQIYFSKALPIDYIKTNYPTQVEFLIAIDLRRFIDKNDNNSKIIGSFPSVYKFVIPTNEFLNLTHYQLVELIDNEINSVINKPNVLFANYKNNYLKSKGDLYNYQSLLINLIGNKKRELDRLSNLGVNRRNNGKWEIEDLLFNQNISDVGSSIVLNQISTENGMNIVFGHVKGIFVEYDHLSIIENEEEIFNSICENFKNSLLE